MRAKHRGFTLLELMVVLVIVGIVLSFVGLSAGGDSRARQMEEEAQRLLALFQLASEEAILHGEQLAVRFTDSRYEFLVLRETKWQPIKDDSALRPRELPAGIESRLELEDSPPPNLSLEESELPQVFLLSSGEMTPFILTFSAEGTDKSFQLKANLMGQLELE